MGQKLEKVSEKEVGSTNGSDGRSQPEPAGALAQSERKDQRERRDQAGAGNSAEAGCPGSVGSNLDIEGRSDDITVTPAPTDAMRREPMSPALDEERRPLTFGGGDRGGRAVTRQTDGVLGSDRSTQHSEPLTRKKAVESKKRVDAMEEQARSKSLAGRSNVDADVEDWTDQSNTKDLEISEPTEENVVLLEKHGSWLVSDPSSAVAKSMDKEKEKKQAAVKRIVEGYRTPGVGGADSESPHPPMLTTDPTGTETCCSSDDIFRSNIEEELYDEAEVLTRLISKAKSGSISCSQPERAEEAPATPPNERPAMKDTPRREAEPGRVEGDRTGASGSSPCEPEAPGSSTTDVYIYRPHPSQPPARLQAKEGSDGQKLFVTTQEREPVCHTAVIGPQCSIDFTQTEERNSSGVSPHPSLPAERPKTKGPPPPVPKKPQNPFKVPAAKTRSADNQQKANDYHRQDKKKRRHSHQVDQRVCTTAPRDMCVLWDNTGAAYTVPSNVYTADNLHPTNDYLEQQRTPTREEKYRNIIDFNAWAQMVRRAAEEEEPKQLDMLDERSGSAKKAKLKGPPPPVPKKHKICFVPEMVTMSEDVAWPSDDEQTQALQKLLLERVGEVDREILLDKFSTDVCRKKVVDHNDWRVHSGLGECGGCEVVAETDTQTYSSVADLVKQTNRMHQSISKADRTEPLSTKCIARPVSQGPSLKVSQMKKAFDVTKRPAETTPVAKPESKKARLNTLLN